MVDSTGRDVQLGHFAKVFVPPSQHSRLTSPLFFNFSKWLFDYDCTFCCYQSGAIEQLPSSWSWKMYFWKKNNLRSGLQAPFILLVYQVTSLDSIEWLDFASLFGNNTDCFTSKLFGASRFGEYLLSEVVTFNWFSSTFSSRTYRCTRSTLFSLYVDHFRLAGYHRIVSQTRLSWVSPSKFLFVDWSTEIFYWNHLKVLPIIVHVVQRLSSCNSVKSFVYWESIGQTMLQIYHQRPFSLPVTLKNFLVGKTVSNISSHWKYVRCKQQSKALYLVWPSVPDTTQCKKLVWIVCLTSWKTINPNISLWIASHCIQMQFQWNGNVFASKVQPQDVVENVVEVIHYFKGEERMPNVA